MTLANVRKQRGLPFLKRGMKVFHHHNNRFGRVSGGNSSGNINVTFDGDSYSQNCHPTWEMTYYDKNGSIIASYHDNI